MKEHRIFGPPGTGKTTYLSRQIELAAQKHGRDGILVASYTKTAAEELVSRETSLPMDAIGTLHAFCYRAIGMPTIAETKIEEFNEANPHYKLTLQKDEEAAAEGRYITDADKLFSKYTLQRARLHPLEALDHLTQGFMHAWESWKLANSYVDFADMIDFAILFDTPPPGNREVGFYDEAQDFNALELKLVRKWAEKQEYVLLAGDDDQALFSFSGASADAFLNPPVPDAQKRVLSQSWRVPRAVHTLAEAWIKQLTRREPKEYKPREAEGAVIRATAQYSAPANAIKMAKEYIADGKTVMFLTSCGYMLNPIKSALRAEGLPFHNPYKKKRGDLNPLGVFGGNGKITYAKDRLLCFLNENGPKHNGVAYWSIGDIAKWSDILSTKGIMKRGAKTRIEEAEEQGYLLRGDEIATFFDECFEDHARDQLLARNIEWFYNKILPAKTGPVGFAKTVYHNYGTKGLTEKPQIILSTIHGSKGGEADVVFLFPDLSVQGFKELNKGGEGKDAIIRMMYVGMTRARESLIIGRPSASMFIRI